MPEACVNPGSRNDRSGWLGDGELAGDDEQDLDVEERWDDPDWVRRFAFMAGVGEYAQGSLDALDEVSETSMRLWGARGLAAMFDGSPTTPPPFRSAGGRRDIKSYDQVLVHEHLTRDPAKHELIDFDPRMLCSTQAAVTRTGVEYYLGGKYRTTGWTYADQHNLGNKHPVVYSRPKMAGEGREHLILNGHHRAAAALLQGKYVKVRHIVGPWGGPR
jgi:hypothetical protein